MKKLIALLIASLFVVACSNGSETAPTTSKPAGDPDDALLEGKADRLTNWYVTNKGEVAMGERVEGEIDYPDWYYGYTMELKEGQAVNINLLLGEEGIVRVYGPAKGTYSDGTLIFRRAKVREWVDTPRVGAPNERIRKSFVADIDFEAEKAGTYMVVFGPSYVWNSWYSLNVTCTAGCGRPDECFSDDECGAGQFCGDNGARCITFPCDVNYNVCQPMPEGSCDNHSDCADGWCRQRDWDASAGKECTPFVGEGSHCSGFAPPQMIESCSPELDCVFRPFIADAPGTCRNLVTVAELQADPDKWDGQRIYVNGNVAAGYAICTQMACTPQNPCCNSCGAEQTLVDPGTVHGAQGISLEQNGQTLGCGGDSCNWAESCDVADGEYGVLGTFRKARYGLLKIEVEELTSMDWVN